MRTSILVEHILMICLMMAKGDLKTSMAEVIRRVEDWQKKECRVFGTSDRDFAGALVSLVFFESELYGTPTEKMAEEMDSIPLEQMVGRILKYDDVYFGDGMQMWCRMRELPTERNLLMRQFFETPRGQNPEEVMRFIGREEMDRGTLEACSSEWPSEFFGTTVFSDLKAPAHSMMLAEPDTKTTLSHCA